MEPTHQSKTDNGGVRRTYALGAQKGDKAQRSIAAELANAASGTPTKPTNTLGSLAGGKVATQTARPSLETFVRRHLAQLTAGADLPALRERITAIAEQRQIEETHSPVLADAEIRRLSDQYAADPTPANRDALRDAKILDARDYSVAQEHARNRIGLILAELTPRVLPLLRAAGELAAADAAGVETCDAALYREWEVEPVASPLVLGLRALALEFTLQSQARLLHGIPELISEILKVEAA